MQHVVPLRGHASPPVSQPTRPILGEDARLFLMTFVSGFCVFYGLIA